MINTVKTTRNTIKLGDKKYYSFTYLKQYKKEFKKDDFIVVKGISYYLSI